MVVVGRGDTPEAVLTTSLGQTFWRRRLSAANFRPSISRARRPTKRGTIITPAVDLDADEQAALDLFRTNGKASTSFLQRKMPTTYRRASMIVESLEKKGAISPADPGGRRTILASAPSPHSTMIESNGTDESPPPYRVQRFGERPTAQESEVPLKSRAMVLARLAGREVLASLNAATSVRDPRVHLILVVIAAFVFAIGQFLGGVAILAYGAMLFLAGKER